MECWPITIMTWKNTWLWIVYWWKMRCVGKEFDTPWKPFLQFHQCYKYCFWNKMYVSTKYYRYIQVKVDREDEDYDKYKVFVESTILQCLRAVIRFQRKFCLNLQAWDPKLCLVIKICELWFTVIPRWIK